MSLNLEHLNRVLRERLAEAVRFVTRPDGAVMLRTRFEFPDGDRFPIHAEAAGPEAVRLSDYGHTLMHISYDRDIDAFLEEYDGAVDQIAREAGIERCGGVFRLDSPVHDLPDAVFRFGQALTRIYELGLRPRSERRAGTPAGRTAPAS